MKKSHSTEKRREPSGVQTITIVKVDKTLKRKNEKGSISKKNEEGLALSS